MPRKQNGRKDIKLLKMIVCILKLKVISSYFPLLSKL